MKNEDMAETVLIKLFGSTSRVRILSLLLKNPDSSFYQREVMYETGLSLQAAQRELSNLVELGIIRRDDGESKVYYRINPDSPLIKPLGELLESSIRRAGK
jgi:predicted transcriptional regulator